MHRKQLMCILIVFQVLICAELWGAEALKPLEMAPHSVGQQNGLLCAQPCSAPGGFNLAPGCCVCQPCACDNAWDGYCEQKARWQAFWSRLGTPRPPRCAQPVPAGAVVDGGGFRRLPPVSDDTEPPEVQTVPDAPLPEPEPTPAPAKPTAAVESSRRPLPATIR